MEYNAWVNQILKRREERESLLSDSDKIDAQVADVAKEYSPSSKKFSMRGADTKVEAVEKGIPDDHPMKGFTPELQDAYRKALADPDLIGYRPKEILAELAGRFAAPRLEPSMEYKRRADSSLTNWFGVFGEDESVKYPLHRIHPEIYQQWKELKQVEEAQTPREGAGFLESVGTAAGLTAGIGGVIGAFGGPAGAVSGAVTGGVLGGLAEIPAYPIRQWIRGTEWYKARESSDSTWDKAKLLAADLGVDVVTGAGIYKGIGKTGIKLAEKAAAKAGGATEELEAAMGAFSRRHEAKEAVNLWKAAKVNAAAQAAAESYLEEFGRSPGFRQAVFDTVAARERAGAATPQALRQLEIERLMGQRAKPEAAALAESVSSMEQLYQAKKVSVNREPREVIKQLDDDSMEAVMNSQEPIGRAVLKAFDEQEVLRKAKILEAERERIAKLAAAGREKEARRVEAALEARNVVEQEKLVGGNSRVAQALWKHGGVEPEVYSGDPLGAYKIAKEGKAALKRLGLKEGELAPKEAIQAEVDLNKWYDDLDVVMPERNMNPVGTAFKEAPEMIETAPGVFEKQKVVDEKTVSELKAGIEKRKSAKDLIVPALGMIATAGLVAADSIFGGKEAEASVGSTIAKAAAKGWKRLYHGTVDSFDTFIKTKGVHLGTKQAAEDRVNKLIEYGVGKEESKRVLELDVKYSNPLKLPVDYGYESPGAILDAVQYSYPNSSLADKAQALRWKHKMEYRQLDPQNKLTIADKAHQDYDARTFKEVFKFLEDQGFDAIEYRNLYEDKGSTSVILWGENQIRNSVTGKFMNFVGPAAVVSGTIGAVAGSPDVSEAGVISTATAALAKGAMKAGKSAESIAKGAVESGLTARPLPVGALEVGDWKPMEQLRLWRKDITEGMTSTAQAIKQVPTMSKTILSRLSPRYFDELTYHEMMMPSTQLASASSAIQHNVPEYLQLVKNIMDQHPLAGTYKAAMREVNVVMEPFAKRYYADKIAFDAIDEDLKSIGKQLKEFEGKKSPQARNAVSALQTRAASLEKAKGELLPSLQSMSADHAALVEPLAAKYPTVRIALAAEDTSSFTKYPFLKGMMTRDDAVAAARIKDLMEHFSGRIQAAGEKVIKSEPYIHHATHPVSSTAFAQKRLDELGVGGGLTAPLAKFFSRSENSLQLFPEINYIMQRYIPDAERRIQYATFWQKGKKWGWDSHQWNDVVQSTPVLRDYWSRIRESLQPPPETFWNKLANRYSTLEVIRLIGFAPSVALKHAFKVSGSMAMAGPSATLRNLPKATVLWAKNMIRQNADRAMIKSLGIDMKQPGALEELAYTYAHNNRMMQNILDYEINTLARGDRGFMSQFDKWTRTLADWGGSLVNAVEQWDRTFNVLVATEMAAKKGLTTEQAIHGILGTTLRNNFLGGPLNPRWLASPVLRSIFIFQGTPFKLWERRFMNAYHTGKAIKAAWGESYKGEGIRGVLNEMAGLKRYIQDGERELKQNLIYDAFNSKRDILGGSMPAQLMKEMLLLGTVMSVGGYLNMDFTPQVLHLPFVKTDRQEPGVTTNPFINAFFKTAAQRREAAKYDEEPDFYVSSFAKNWLGKSGVIPAAFHKMMRISDNDIPEIYKDSPLKYFFAVPAKK